MTIDVTEDDITHGSRDCRYCPVALAVERATGKATSVCPVWIRFRKTDYIMPIPDNVKAFLREYDAFRPVKPFSFELETP